MSVAEMRMLRWMCCKTRKDKIRNEDIHLQVEIALIEDKLKENHLWWFSHRMDWGMCLLEGWSKLTLHMVEGWRETKNNMIAGDKKYEIIRTWIEDYGW